MTNSFDKDFWTKVLSDKGLESPGYHEAVEATNLNTRMKNMEKLAPKENKTKKNKR